MHHSTMVMYVCAAMPIWALLLEGQIGGGQSGQSLVM